MDEEYYLKVTVASSIGAEDWVSISIPNQLYYTNTPGLEEGVINHTALSEVLSYEDADLTVNQTEIYAQENGTVRYQIKENALRASFFIGLRADSNFFNGNPSGMTVSDIIQIAVGNQGESNAAHTAQMTASITDNIPRVIKWVRGESLSNTNGVLDYPVTGFQRKNPYLCRTSHGADETLGIYTATYDLIYDKGADLNSVDCATILSTEEYNDDPTKMVAHCQSDLMSGRFRFKPVITYPSGAGFSVDQTYSIIVSNIDVTMYGDTSGFDASMGIEGTTLNITIVSPATSSFTAYAHNAASYNWRLQDTPDKSYAAACDRLAWLGYKYDNPSVPCTEPLAFELFIDEGSDSAPGGQGLIHFATLPNWIYASVYWEAVNVDDPGDVKSGTIDGADLEYRYTTETGSTSFDDYVMVAVEDFGLDPSKYSLSYVKADVTTVPAGASSYGYNPAWMYYIDAHLMSPAVFGTFRSSESGDIYTRMKLSTVPSDGTDPVVKFQTTSVCYSNTKAGAFTAGRTSLPQSSYTIDPGESLQLKNVYTNIGDFYYCSGWFYQGGRLLNDTSTVADPVLYMILPEGIGYRDLFLKIGDKPTEYTIEDITDSATNPGTKTIYKISFPEGTMIGWYDENCDDRRLGINVELTSSYDTEPGTYVLSDMFFLGSEDIQAGWSGANANTSPSSDTYTINNGRPLSRVIIENTVLSVQENDTVTVTNAVRTLDAEGNETAGWKTYDSYTPDDTTAILPISKEGSGELVLNVTNLVASRESLSQLTIYVPISRLDADMGEVFMNNPQEFSVDISVKDAAGSSTKFDYAYARLNSPCDGSAAPDCTIATTEEEIASADLMIITLKAGETLAYGRENTEKIYFEVRTDGKDGTDGAIDLFTPFTIYTANETDIFAINDIVGFSIRAYTVTYHANGGENPPIDYESPYSPDSTVVVLDKTDMTRENHVFTGWNTKSDGSGTTYLPQETFTITQSVNLYAQWEEIATGALTVSKTINGNAASPTQAFTFTVTLSDTSLSGEYGDMFFENGVATFTLKGGESKTASSLPDGISYIVAESDNDGYQVRKTGDTGSIVGDETATAAFTNTRNSSPTPDDPDDPPVVTRTGSLTISKTVTGTAGDTEKAFTFTVTLGASGSYSYTGSKSGTISSGGTVELKHGESITISGLPEGTSYLVAESGSDGYQVTKSGDTGTIAANTTVTASFTNKKDVSTPPATPKTGDNSHMALWIGLLLASFIGMSTCIILFRKKKHGGKYMRTFMLLLMVGVMAFSGIGATYALAADGTAGYTYGQYDMTYLPGTADTVTNMPANETGLTPGRNNPYTVSSTVPQREGFEFIDWMLNWGTMEKPITLTGYTVKYLDADTLEPVAPEKTVYGLEVGTTVSESAVGVDGHIALDPTEASLELAESGNEIIFFYEKEPVLASYTIRYLDTTHGFVDIAEPKTVTGVPVGEGITEYALVIPGYTPWIPSVSFEVQEGENEQFIFYFSGDPSGD